MKNIYLPIIIAFMLATLQQCSVIPFSGSDPVHVLVVTGGHRYDTVAFMEMFDALEGISYDTVMQPRANHMIRKENLKEYQAIVFYDAWREISRKEQKRYKKLTRKGKGMVFLHHSLGSYQHWEGYSDIIGGRYYRKGSGHNDKPLMEYTHDLDIMVHVVDRQHPVTRGIPDFTIHDEGYTNLQYNQDITPLLVTAHPACSDTIAWVNPVRDSRVVYMMLGHDAAAYTNLHYREILRNAIYFSAGRTGSEGE